MMLDRRKFIASAAFATGTAMVGRSAICGAAADESIEIGNEPQLLIDDWIVAHRDGLKRTLHQPKKHGLIKHTDGSDWDRGSVYQGNIVCQDNSGKFHMTYRYYWWDTAMEKVIGPDRAHWFHETTGYATSQDGIHWDKPELGIVEGPSGFRKQPDFPFESPTGMSKKNNLGCPIDFIYDLHANGNIIDPEKRFLLRVVELDSLSPFAKLLSAQMYFAADWPDFAGDPNWRDKLTPIPGATLSPRRFKTLCGYDHRAGEWFMTSQAEIQSWLKRHGRDIVRYSSPDLVSWSGPELVLPVPEDESRQPNHWIEYMDLWGHRVGGKNTGAWLGQLWIFDSDRTDPQFMMPTMKNVWRKGRCELRLVLSRDAGQSWQRVGGKQVWLPHHPEEDGYDRLVCCSVPVPMGDELRFYYTGWDGEHLAFFADGRSYYKDRMRVARTAWATLRRAGYVSLDAKDGGGQFTTKPLRFMGEQLTVNLVAPRGALQVEIQDESGRPVDGFAADDCVPLASDGVALKVQWRNQQSLQKLAGQPVRLRFDLQNGSLYAFQFS